MTGLQLQFQQYLRTHQLPLDSALLLNGSVSDVDTIIPLSIRYPGLIFFATTENLYYYFDNDLTTAKEFTITSGINAIVVDDPTDYSNILVMLNSLSANNGKQIYIIPLGITVVKNTTNSTWKYISGEYNLTADNNTDLINYWNTIPLTLRQPLVEVLATVNNAIINMVVDMNGDLSDKVIISNSQTQPSVTNVVEGTILLMSNGSYILSEGSWHSLTSTTGNPTVHEFIININAGVTTLNHNLGNTNILVYFFTANDESINLGYNIIDENNITIDSIISLDDIKIELIIGNTI